MSLRRLSKFSPKPTGAGLVNLSKPRLRMADGGEGLSTADRIARTRQATYQVKQGDPVVMSQGLPTSYPSNTDLFMNSVDRGLTSVGNGLRGMVGAAPRQAPDIQAQAMAVNKMFAPVEPTLRQPMQPVEAPPEIRFNDGGSVPGRGEGDKVPALYEPGEFVVSNDMLDAAPSLRGELHSLRTQVLAKKGMTPEEADDKAVSGGTLRANTGFGGEDEQMVQGPAAQRPSATAGVSSLRPTVGGVGSTNTAQPLGFAPGTRAVLNGFADDANSAFNEPTAPAKVGQFVRSLGKATLATPVAMAHDLLRPMIGDGSGTTLRDVGYGIANTAATIATGDSKPMFEPRKEAPAAPSPSLRAPTKPAVAPAISAPVAPESIAGVPLRGAQGRPAMSASDPGMQGIQARQDGRMQSLRQKLQYDQEVAAADKVNEAGRRMNLEYGARRGNRQDARTLASMDATAAADKGNAVTLRGQDMKLRGEIYQADGAARSAAAKGRYDSLRDERTYRDGRTDKTFEQRQSARKAMDERIATKFVDKEGKPDIARAADYKDSVAATLAALAAEARAKGDTAKADRLAAADYSNMDSEDEAMIQQLFDAKQSAKSNASWYNGKFVDDKNLLSYRPEGIRKNMTMSSNVRTQNGTELNVNDARDQGLFGGPGSSNLDTYLAQAQQLEAQRLRTQGR